MSRYSVAVGLMKFVELEVPDPPPCLFCGKIGFEPSMGGPLVCGACDMGKNHDHTRKTSADYERGKIHRREYIEKYKVITDEA